MYSAYFDVLYNDFLPSEFLRGFMDILRRQYGTRRILANSVYQEYIKDKDHYHMNATRVMTFDEISLRYKCTEFHDGLIFICVMVCFLPSGQP